MILDQLASQAAGLSVSRRSFLQVSAAAGGGLMLSLTLPFANGAAQAADAQGFAPNACVRIEGDGQIVLTMPYVEMGQGTYTSISMLIAEELEVDLNQVRLNHAPPNEKLYGNPLLGGIQATGNSNAIRASWKPLREAGAIARTMLVEAAAQRWNVDPASCRAKRVKCFTGRPDKAPNTAISPPPPPACPFPRTCRSSDRKISSSSAPQPSVWTRRQKSTERPFMASMFARLA